MKKNPHAVALGRKGGKAKGKPKGFAAMTKEEADAIRKRAAMIRSAQYFMYDGRIFRSSDLVEVGIEEMFGLIPPASQNT